MGVNKAWSPMAAKAQPTNPNARAAQAAVQLPNNNSLPNTPPIQPSVEILVFQGIQAYFFE
jgi:hypothetical protein